MDIQGSGGFCMTPWGRMPGSVKVWKVLYSEVCEIITLCKVLLCKVLLCMVIPC